MTGKIIIVILMVALLVMIPLAPALIEVRIRFLRWMGLESFARFHERNLHVVVWVVRGVMIAVVVVLGILVF